MCLVAVAPPSTHTHLQIHIQVHSARAKRLKTPPLLLPLPL